MAINPLQKPIDYAGMFPQVDIGKGIEELSDTIIKAKEASDLRAQAEQYRVDLEETINNPTQEKFAQFTLKYPKQYQSTEAARKAYGEEKVKNDFNQGFEISTALESANPNVAKSKLDIIIEAKKNSGESSLVYEQIRDAIDRGEITEAQAGVNAALVIIDPERFKKTVEAQVAARKAPSEISEAMAKADKAVADADIALATAGTAFEREAAILKKAQADADKADIQAQFEERNQKIDLKKKAADLGLTTAQTNEVFVRTRKLGTEAQKAILELAAFKKSGGVDPEKRFSIETTLRKEYQTRTKKYSDLNSINDTISISAKDLSGAGDIALITSFVKMLDPTGVVRETDFAIARDTAGLYGNLVNQLEKAKNGKFLTPRQRQEYVGLSQKYLDAAQIDAKKVKEGYGNVIKDFNLNPQNIFGTEAPPVAPPAAAPAAGATQRNVKVDY